MRRILLCLLVLLLVGCGSKPKSLAGKWQSDPNGSNLALWLAEDGTFAMMQANAPPLFAMRGTYKQTEDQITFTFTDTSAKRSSEKMTAQYFWLGADKFRMSVTQNQVTGRPEDFARVGPALATITDAEISKAPEVAQQTGENASQGFVKSDSDTCRDQMKQLALGMRMYSQDYDDVLPPADSWSEALMPYEKTKDAFTCPTLRKQGQEGGYAMNLALSGAKTGTIADSSNTPLLFESSSAGLGAFNPPSGMLTSPRHGNDVWIAYADGAVRRR